VKNNTAHDGKLWAIDLAYGVYFGLVESILIGINSVLPMNEIC
jgi:hypothetical protein